MCYTYHMLALLKLDGIALGFAGADLIALPVVAGSEPRASASDAFPFRCGSAAEWGRRFRLPTNPSAARRFFMLPTHPPDGGV